MFGLREGSQSHPWIITGKILITSNVYKDARMSSQQKQRVETHGDLWGDKQLV